MIVFLYTIYYLYNVCILIKEVGLKSHCLNNSMLELKCNN